MKQIGIAVFLLLFVTACGGQEGGSNTTSVETTKDLSNSHGKLELPPQVPKLE